MQLLKKILPIFIIFVSGIIFALLSFMLFAGNIQIQPLLEENMASFINLPYPLIITPGLSPSSVDCGSLCHFPVINYSGIEKNIILWTISLFVLIFVHFSLKRKEKLK